MTHYLLKYNYYKNVLCENKDKPELKCNGTCHLAKELKATKAPAEAPVVPSILEVKQVLFLDFKVVSECIVESETNTTSIFDDALPQFLFSDELLDPPRV